MGLYDVTKDALSLFTKTDNIELYQKILEFQAIAIELQNENSKLLEENKKLKLDEEISSKLIFKNNSDYLREKDKEEGPYCSMCWDKDKQLTRMHFDENWYTYKWICPIDKSEYDTKQSTDKQFVQSKDIFISWD